MEQLDLLKVSRAKNTSAVTYSAFSRVTREAVSSAVALRRGQLVRGAFVVVARSSVAEDVEAE